MRTITQAILATLLVLTCWSVQADGIKVIVNSEAVDQLSRSQLRNLYLGGAGSNGLEPIALSSDNISRIIFNTRVLGLPESRIQSFWAQMQFSGRKSPPREFSSPAMALEYVQSHPGALAYVPAEIPIPEGLTVVLEITQ